MISVRDLSKRYRGREAIRGISFEVKAGECFALLGPNGSGKTTTLKCFAGLVLPSSGAISIGGSDAGRDPCGARRQVSYLPQQTVFPEHVRVKEVLEFYARLRGLPSRRVQEVLELLDCTAFAGRAVSELSGGMRQRLAIAVACLPDAPVLLLDEPTASLDPASAAGFRELLAGFKANGTTIVFASHVLADVEALADRVAILVEGRLLAVEQIGTLRGDSRWPQRMRVALRGNAGDYVGVARAAGAERVSAETCELSVVAMPERRVAILRALERSGAAIESFSTEQVTLDEIYLRYMHGQNLADNAAGDLPGGMQFRAAEAC